MKRILGMLCVVCGVAGAGIGRAQTSTPPTYVVTTVDAVRRTTGRLYVTGVLEGASGPSVIQVDIYSSGSGAPESMDSCERLALMVMTKPGQYRFQVWKSATYGYDECGLVKVNP